MVRRVEVATDRRTRRRRTGDRAEHLAAEQLRAIGWTVLARNVRVGRAEIDIIAEEPGAAPTLVFVEVRSRSTRGFGSPEESVVGRKTRAVYHAVLELLRHGHLPDGRRLPRIAWRVDLIAVIIDGGAVEFRHLRGIAPD
jgi:putative endonuclease